MRPSNYPRANIAIDIITGKREVEFVDINLAVHYLSIGVAIIALAALLILVLRKSSCWYKSAVDLNELPTLSETENDTGSLIKSGMKPYFPGYTDPGLPNDRGTQDRDDAIEFEYRPDDRPKFIPLEESRVRPTSWGKE